MFLCIFGTLQAQLLIISLCVHHTGRFSFTWHLTVHNVHSIPAQRQPIKWTEWPGACGSPSTPAPHSWRCALNSSAGLSWVTWVLLYQSNVRLCFLTTSSQSLLTTYLTCLPGIISPAFPSMKPKLKPLLTWGRRDYNASQRHKSKWTETRLKVMQRCERKWPWREDWPYLHWVKFSMLKPQSRITVILRLVLYPHPLADLSVSGRNNRNPSPSHVQASVSKTSRMWKKEKMKESGGELLASLPHYWLRVCVWGGEREGKYVYECVCVWQVLSLLHSMLRRSVRSKVVGGHFLSISRKRIKRPSSITQYLVAW